MEFETYQTPAADYYPQSTEFFYNSEPIDDSVDYAFAVEPQWEAMYESLASLQECYTDEFSYPFTDSSTLSKKTSTLPRKWTAEQIARWNAEAYDYSESQSQSTLPALAHTPTTYASTSNSLSTALCYDLTMSTSPLSSGSSASESDSASSSSFSTYTTPYSSPSPSGPSPPTSPPSQPAATPPTRRTRTRTSPRRSSSGISGASDLVSVSVFDLNPTSDRDRDVLRLDRRRLPCLSPGCTRRFTSQYTLKVHMEAHKPKPRVLFPCREAGCREWFSRQHDRLRHEVSKHDKVCEFSCDACGRFFSTSRTLGSHKCPRGEGMGTRWVMDQADSSSNSD